MRITPTTATPITHHLSGRRPYGDWVFAVGPSVAPTMSSELIEVLVSTMFCDDMYTGIGTLLPTGSSIGPGTNLYGAQGFAPAFLPAFSWGAGARRQTHRLEAFLDSARRVMERRGQTLDGEEAGMLRAVFRATEPDRIAG